jgi:hypothetical protein
MQLVKKGYRVVLAPPDIQDHLITFYGISAWGVRIQKHKGKVQNSIKENPIELNKALRTVILMRELKRLSEHFFPCDRLSFIREDYILEAERICTSLIDQNIVQKQCQEMQNKITRLEAAWRSNENLKESPC